jgi:SAM-dependent methyltransferase
MRKNDCPICVAASARILFKSTLPADFNEAWPIQPYSAHYRIMQCEGCGVLFSDPVMDEAGVARLYTEARETNVIAGEEENVARTMRGYYRLAAPHLRGRGRMLDVGCDTGLLLQAAREDGFAELYGIEPVSAARAQAQLIPGSHISRTFFENADYPADHFDLICFIHVLDHLFRPRVALRKAFTHLRPGGIVVAVVHNVRSLLFYLLRERFPVFNLYHHYFFDPKTLAALFTAEGYEVIGVERTRNCYSLGFYVSRLPGAPESIRNAIGAVLKTVGLTRLPVTIPVGNIAIVARRPAAASA